MRLLITILIYLFLCFPAWALDVRVNSSIVLVDPILVLITDTAYPPTPLPGQTTSTVTFNYACGSQTVSTLAGVTLTEIDATNKDGRYWMKSTATLTGCSIPDILTVSGGGTDKDVPPVVVNLIANIGAGSRCQITAATSGVSFTIASCVDYNGASITLATDYFVGMEMEAINRAGTQCNVVGHSVLVNDVTAGVVTVNVTGLAGGGFPATPNTVNCDVRLK